MRSALLERFSCRAIASLPVLAQSPSLLRCFSERAFTSPPVDQGITDARERAAAIANSSGARSKHAEFTNTSGRPYPEYDPTDYSGFADDMTVDAPKAVIPPLDVDALLPKPPIELTADQRLQRLHERLADAEKRMVLAPEFGAVFMCQHLHIARAAVADVVHEAAAHGLTEAVADRVEALKQLHVQLLYDNELL